MHINKQNKETIFVLSTLVLKFHIYDSISRFDLCLCTLENRP